MEKVPVSEALKLISEAGTCSGVLTCKECPFYDNVMCTFFEHCTETSSSLTEIKNIPMGRVAEITTIENKINKIKGILE